MAGRPALTPALAGVAAALLAAGCSGVEAGRASDATQTVPTSPAPTMTSPGPHRTATGGVGRRAPQPSATATSPARAGETSGAEARETREPHRAYLTIQAIGLRRVPVVRYNGSPDDAEGTRIQNRGPTASPRGRSGGVGPGEVGNFIVTGHRTSHSAPFRDLPSLGAGERVRVRSGRTVYVYEITETRWTSFRSTRSRAEQTAAVPGRPRARPTQPMITLSTCATPEDQAAGNYWSDRFGNPEHRIDKVGVLVRQIGTGA